MCSVKVGLHLTNQHPRDSDPRVGLTGQLRLLEEAQRLGWDSVWVAHHFLTEDPTMLQPVPFLAHLAAKTDRMILGTGIHLLALANPIAAAEEIATLDVLSDGRVVYGVGLGYQDHEFEALGVRGARVDRFERNLEAVLKLWAGDPVDLDLPWCRVDGRRLSVLPMQRPRPPVWLAANSDAAVRRAARLGDAWLMNPHAPLTTIRRQLMLFTDERDRVGANPVTEVPLIREAICSDTDTQAWTLASNHLAAKYDSYRSWGQDRFLPGHDSFGVPFDELASERFVVGSPARCRDQLRRWVQLGVTHLILRVHWSGMPVEESLRTMNLLDREVLPSLTVPA